MDFNRVDVSESRQLGFYNNLKLNLDQYPVYHCQYIYGQKSQESNLLENIIFNIWKAYV